MSRPSSLKGVLYVCVCAFVCVCASAPLKLAKFLTPQKNINARILHIKSISTGLSFFHPLLAGVLMIGNTIQFFKCRLCCCQMKNVVYPANFSFSLVLKMDYVIELIAKGIWGGLAPI